MDGLSEPQSSFHWPSQLLPWYMATHRRAIDTATSVSNVFVVCLCIVVGRGLMSHSYHQDHWDAEFALVMSKETHMLSDMCRIIPGL